MDDALPAPSVAGAGVTKNKGPRACTTCAKAKSRCHPGPIPSICERCHRLNKPCSSQTPAPPRMRREARPNRVAELERRLHDLTKKLQPVVEAQHQHQQQQHQLSPPASTPETLEDPQHPPPASKRAQFGGVGLLHLLPGMDISVDSAVEPDEPAGVASPSTTRSHSNSMHTDRPSVLPGATAAPPAEKSLWLDPAEAALLLQEYHDHMKDLFPFVVVSPHLGSGELCRQRPFLWKAIMIVACHMDGRRQMAMAHQMLTEIATATLMASAKTLDLLQGILILLAWFNFGLSSFQITNLLFLARSLCVSLGLGEPQANRPLTSVRLEELRAYAGTYYIVTLTFAANKKHDALMATSNLEAYCQAIQSRMEHPTDEPLVYLVRAQQLIQSLSLALAPFYHGSTPPPGGLSLDGIVRTFEQQIAALEQGIPERLRGNHSLMSHVHVARIQLYEISLNELPQSTQDPAFSAMALHSERLGLLGSCLDACRRYIAFRFNRDVAPRPCDQPVCVSLASFDFVVAKLASLKLWMLQTPGWDRAFARKELDLEFVANRMVDELQCAVLQRRLTIPVYFSCPPSTAGPSPADFGDAGGPPDIFETLRQRLVFIRTALLSEAQGDGQKTQALSDRIGVSVDAADASTSSSAQGQGSHDDGQSQQSRQMQPSLQQQQNQAQQEELLPHSHVPMSDLDLDSWAATLFSGEDGWDPSNIMTFDWSM